MQKTVSTTATNEEEEVDEDFAWVRIKNTVAESSFDEEKSRRKFVKEMDIYWVRMDSSNNSAASLNQHNKSGPTNDAVLDCRESKTADVTEPNDRPQSNDSNVGIDADHISIIEPNEDVFFDAQDAFYFDAEDGDCTQKFDW